MPDLGIEFKLRSRRTSDCSPTTEENEIRRNGAKEGANVEDRDRDEEHEP